MTIKSLETKNVYSNKVMEKITKNKSKEKGQRFSPNVFSLIVSSSEISGQD